ncbi:MAG: glycoside hydrolase [Opitutae bacterium]|nr:glycoside hydrolase [Opitutae bacterium]
MSAPTTVPAASFFRLLGLGVCLAWVAAAAAPIRPDLASSLQATQPLEEGWQNPPQLARTRVWWWWLNGNVTKAALTRDLEEMKAKGLGGANVIDAGGDNQRDARRVPHGPDFGSPAWRELFLHALAEADRLGLELGLNIQSGWNLGGPTVTIEESAKKLVYSDTIVEGGARVETTLPEPMHREPFYRDVAVLALPAPPPGATPPPPPPPPPAKTKSKEKAQPVTLLPRLAEKAYERYPGIFTATTAWHLLETGDATPADAPCRPEDLINLTARVDAAGKLVWDAPPGRWSVLRFGYTVSGAHVSTCSEGGEGWAIDYLDATAFETYWQRVLAPIFAEAKPYLGKSLRFLHTDSWELGPVNWTAAMPAQFQRLRGYELTAFLPVFANRIIGSREISTRFLNDLRRTLAELIAENNYRVFARHAHALGLGIHPESGGPHAAPVDALLNLGISDVPMGEFWAPSATHRTKPEQRFFVKQTSSAAHVYGLRISLAEAFTSIGPHWEEDPRSLKASFDRAACEGHNLTMWHTFDCSPAEMGLPGQAYFAGSHLNPNTTWWPQAGAFFSYLNRCHFLLQQGLPVSDVLHFYGENIPSFVRLKDDDPAGAAPDYDYDVIDLNALLTRTRTDSTGRVALPDGVSYPLLSITPHDAIGLPVLRHLATLVRGGATLVGRPPARPYGLGGGPAAETEFAALVAELWGQNPAAATPHRCGRGQVFADTPARELLPRLGVGRDFAWTGGEADTLIDYIHRRTDRAEIYFVANRQNRRESGTAAFRVTGRRPELWDPVTGQRRALPVFAQEGAITRVPLRFEAEQAFFVIFREPAPTTAPVAGAINFTDPTPLQTLSGPWTVQFDPAWGGPAEAIFTALTDWSQHAEEGIRHYSGTAVYVKTFNAPAPAPGARVLLDLGELKNLAEVTLNGRPLGVLWSAPFRVDVTDALRPGENALRIKIVNLWPNRLIGDQHLPKETRRTRTNIAKFELSRNQTLLPSGLFGPVQLLTAR